MRFGHLAGRLGELLVRDRERHVIGNPPRGRHVLRGERGRLSRPESQTHLLITRAREDAQK